jgi:twitching motility protein PilT
MKTLDQMLHELARPDVGEFAVVSDRLPCIKVGAKYEPVDDRARSTEAILDMLASTGGRGLVEDLPQKPAAWTHRVEGVGTVAVHAVMRDGRVQARFTMVAPAPMPAPAPAPARPAPLPLSASPGLVFEPPPPPRAAPAPSVPEVLMTNAAFSAGSAPELAPAVNGAQGDPDPFMAGATYRPTAARGSSPALSPLEGYFATMYDVAASDLHLVSERAPLFRVGGELASRGSPVSADAVDEMLLPLVPERLRSVLAEVGSADFAIDRPGFGRFRVNIARQRTGLKGCFRRIPEAVPTLASLVLPAEIARATHHHQGLVLVTGPTGHGKTTTLAAIVDIINRETTHHIITVEDPIEFLHPRKKAMISQREVGSHTRSFQNALKASLREDPDVIVVGELRDTETVRMALAASETGHLVIGTMNTPSAAKTIDRVVDLFPPADQQQVRMGLAGGLHLVIGQRLLPAANGRGMVAAVELLPGSVALWSLIRDNKTYQIPSLQQRGKGIGIVRLDESLADLVREGRATKAAALAVAESPDDLEGILAGKRGPGALAPVAPPPAAPKPDAAGGILGKAGQIFKRGS